MDYRELIRDVSQIIIKHKDKLNKHNSAEKIVNYVLKQKVVCDHNPRDTKIWTIAKVKNLKPYPFK